MQVPNQTMFLIPSQILLATTGLFIVYKCIPCIEQRFLVVLVAVNDALEAFRKCSITDADHSFDLGSIYNRHNSRNKRYIYISYTAFFVEMEEGIVIEEKLRYQYLCTGINLFLETFDLIYSVI